MSIKTSGEYEEKGRAHLLADRPQEALAEFEEGARRFPGDDDLLMGTALALGRLGEHARAVRILEELKERRPSSDVYLGLVEAQLNRGLIAPAVKTAREALDAEPDARTAVRMARVFFDHRRRQEALPFYERAVGLDSGWSEAWFGLGACLWALKQGEAAERALRRAVELDPADHQARQFWGCALHDLGRKDEARAALEAVPLDAPWQRAALERLVALGWWPSDPERARRLETLWRS